jgi:hypothetical protein
VILFSSAREARVLKIASAHSFSIRRRIVSQMCNMNFIKVTGRIKANGNQFARSVGSLKRALPRDTLATVWEELDVCHVAHGAQIECLKVREIPCLSVCDT